jgi:RHS repeat-associated protein
MKLLRVLFAVIAVLAGTLAHAQINTVHGGRFTRGTGTDPSYQTFVIPLDFQEGYECQALGGSLATLYFPFNSTTNFLYNATNTASETNLSLRIPFQNPVAAFSTRVGTPPLYFGQTYRFGVYAGDPSGGLESLALRLAVYRRSGSTFTLQSNIPIAIPAITDTNAWLAFGTNGFSVATTNFGLTTIVSFHNVYQQWGAAFAGSYVITHEAQDSGSTNYVYQMEAVGLTDHGALVKDGSSNAWYSRLYVMEFIKHPAGRALFVDAPQFQREPMPPGFQGKTLDELLTNLPPASSTVSLSGGATTCTNLDQSPELRRHPILDRFVSDMGSDPIALARYVHNEIELTDAIDLNETGSFSEISVNPGGVSRGALATYLEGQGSPAEQCALLVYLLRQAKVPAVYCYPAHNALKLPDQQVSKLLRMQLVGAVNDKGQQWTTNTLIPVNYPWVAAYVGTNWIHLFPWLKDTEVTEGLNLYDYMPAGYENGFKWARDYFFGKTNILGLATDDDTPLALFPKFIQNTLSNSAPGISIDDLRAKWFDRRKGFARWTDFPRPFVVPSTNVALDTLTSPGITNVFPGLTNIFDTIQVDVSSVANPAKKVSSGEVRLLDLHNRRLLVRHEKTGTNLHNLILNLATWRTNATGPTNFTAGDALLNTQQVSTALNSTDDTLSVRLLYKRHRSMPPSIATNVPGYWASYPGLTATFVVDDSLTIRKGDLAAVCLNAGRVTPAMLRVQAEELWNMERTLAANTNAVVDPNLLQGGTAFLMGMSYYENLSRFDRVNQQLHKIVTISQHAHGLAKLVAKRVGGALPNNGDITLNQPAVDVPFSTTVIVGNRTLHPDSGDEHILPPLSYLALSTAHGSAEEHQIINRFFGQKDSISTVKLLQMAQSRATNGNPTIQTLNYQNFTSLGNTSFGGTQLKSHDTNIWKSVTNFLSTPGSSNYTLAYLTPGVVTNVTGSYKGMGALLWSVDQGRMALISPNLNGGFGELVPDNTFQPGTAVNYTLTVLPNGDYKLTIDTFTPASPGLAPLTLANYDTPIIVQDALQGDFVTTPVQDTANRWLSDGNVVSYLPADDTGSEKFGRATQAQADRGWWGGFLSAANKAWDKVSDPVSAVTGEFYVDTADLTLPGPMPIVVRRNYSSLNLAENQFGHGWKPNYLPFLTVSVDGTVVYGAEADGSVLAYKQQGTNSVWLVDATLNPLLDNYSIQGAGSTANRLRNRLVKTNDVYTLYGADGSKRTYQLGPYAGFSASKPYLLKWEDARGNYHSFEYGTDSTQTDFGEVRRILASNGNILGFRYDVYGHIIEAYTSDGRRVLYEYDQFGDLRNVTLPDQSEIAFEYERKTQTVSGTATPYSTHLLLTETKPDGRLLINQYDAQRRVTNQLSTVGVDLRPIRSASFAYTNNFSLTNTPGTAISGSTTIYDVNNNPTVYRYASGLITNIVDAAGIGITNVWWQPSETNSAGYYPRSVHFSWDRRALKSEYRYDTNGNITTNIVTGDLTGDGTSVSATTTTTWNTNNLPDEITDPVGNKKHTYYHATFRFLPEYVVKLAGTNVITTNKFVYHSVTNITATATNIAQGLLQQSIRAFNSPDAATDEWTHDARGFATGFTRYTGTTDPNVTLTLVHNNRGELIEQIDAANRTNRFTFDALGRRQSHEVIDESGNRVTWEFAYYNPNGELTWEDGPRYNPEDYIWHDYDGAGREVQNVRWRSQPKSDGTGVEAIPGYDLFATSTLTYNNYGSLVGVLDRFGNITTNRYDAIGRLTQRQQLDAFFLTPITTESYAYEPGNQVSYVTNALGGITQLAYTGDGQKKFFKGADGSTNGWRYDLAGRLTYEFLRNGAYWRTFYDDANRTVTRVFYNATNTPLATNSVVFDQRGNPSLSTDAAFNTTTNWFDDLDRLRITHGPQITYTPPPGAPSIPGTPPAPVQQKTTNVFDAAGIEIDTYNALGEKSVTRFDALGRTVKTEVRDAANNLMRVTTTGYTPDHHGMTVTNGTGAGTIVTTSYTDTLGSPALVVGYPASGVREFVRYVDNQSARLRDEIQLVTTNTSTPIQLHIHRYESDYAQRLKRDEHNSSVAYFYYDQANNLTNRVLPDNLKWAGTYDSANRLIQEFTYSDASGFTATRTNSYGYYATGNKWAGLPQTRTNNGLSVICTYTYDDWLRPLTNTHTGPLDEHKLTTAYAYDARGFLTNLVEQFTGTTNKVTLSRAYDAYGLLTSETAVYPTGGYGSTASQSWDSAGRRSALGFGPFGYRYAWFADGLLAGVTGTYGSGATYDYSDAGLLNSRTVGAKSMGITSRDGRGRVTGEITSIAGDSTLTETLTWTGDGLLASHSLVRPDYTDGQLFTYQSATRRLSTEILRISASLTYTNSFTYDGGDSYGLGVLTGVSAAGSATLAGGQDAFQRLTTETNNVARRTAYGTVNGPAKINVSVDGAAMPVTLVGTNSAQWRTLLELTTGSHTLTATAIHPSGLFTTNATSTFTVTNTAPDRLTASYDAIGQITNRVWKDANGTTTRSQALVWDAKGRLYKITDRDANSSGFNWQATYDALGRRLLTQTTIVTNNVAFTAQQKVIGQYYDPQFEFLELGVTEKGTVADTGKTTWKVYGPDLNGRYGAQNGLGGFDAIVPGVDLFCPVIADARGNLSAVYDQDHASLTWFNARPSGYGAVPGRRPLPLSNGADVAGASAWRGRWSDLSGLYNIGTRYYDPTVGHFLSADPLGHDATWDLYSAFRADPINRFDPNGRYAGIAWAGVEGAAEGGWNEVIGVGKFAKGMTYDLGEQIGLMGLDIYEAEMGGDQFESAAFKSVYNMMLQGKSNAEMAGELALNVSGYRFGNQIYENLEYGNETGDYSQFSQNMTAVALTAAGGFEKAPTTRPPESPFYEVGYEAQLQRGSDFPGVSEQRHFQEGNRQLHEEFQADPDFARQMEQLYPGINEGVQPGPRGAYPREAPTPDTTWHHHPNREGVLQLITTEQHTAPGPVQNSLHPNQRGGMQNWGGGRRRP